MSHRFHISIALLIVVVMPDSTRAESATETQPEATSESRITPLQLALSPEHQLVDDEARVMGLSLACLGNRNRSTHGLSLALWTVPETGGAMTGVEIGGGLLAARPAAGVQAGLVCADATTMAGLQLSPGLCRGENVRWAQVAGQICIATAMQGLQVASACQADGIQGLQIGAAVCLANAMEGGQIAMASLASTVTGAQIAGFVSEADVITGVQLAGIASAAAKSCDGLQVAPINYAKLMTGVQIGLFNYCQDLQGIQIGLINISWHHPWPVLPLLSIRF